MMFVVGEYLVLASQSSRDLLVELSCGGINCDGHVGSEIIAGKDEFLECGGYCKGVRDQYTGRS
jgi:hypothetical protein